MPQLIYDGLAKSSIYVVVDLKRRFAVPYELVEEVALGIRRQCLPAATEDLRVVKAELADDAGVIGAAALAMESFAEYQREE